MIRRADSNKREDWEALCRRCGRCCYEKIDFEGTIYYTDTPCQHLDPVSKLCRVYPRRDRVRKGCVRLSPESLAQGILPADCPYVAGIDNYRAPVLAED